jgi:ATP-dependent RNA helicase DDX27
MKEGGAGDIKKSLKKSIKQPSRREEMHELFQGEMSESKQARGFRKGTGDSLKKKQKSSFKSKSRYVIFCVLPMGF